MSVTYFGDGATNIGSTLETMNLASAWHLPVCFFIENNRYAVSTTVEEATGEPRLSSRGPGFGIAAWKVDGMDPLAVHLAMTEAVERMRRGERVRRWSRPTPTASSTRTAASPAARSATAPRRRSRSGGRATRSTQTAAQLVRLGILTEDETAQAVAQAKAVMDEIGSVLLEPDPDGKPGQRRIRPAEWPDPDWVDVGVRGDLSELDDAPVVTDESSVAVEETKFIDAVATVMGRRMETDDRIVVMGEDVHRLNGGTNGATRGLTDRFPGRVLGTPISENAFAGLAGGIALDGRFTPVVEFMYADFMWVAADQLFNQIAKARHMYGGTGGVPLVLRSKVAMGTGYGSQHSMDPAGIFATSAGWRIVAPSTPYDYVGLMNTALRLQDPVVVLEHVDLYSTSGPGPVDDWDYCLPVGRASVRRPGSDVTVLTYLGMTPYVLEAVEEYGEVDAEVIDLRWLDRASIDWDTIEESLTEDQPGADRRAGRASARRTAGGWPTRSTAGSSTCSTRRCGGSPAARRRRRSARCSNARRSLRQDEVVAALAEIARY